MKNNFIKIIFFVFVTLNIACSFEPEIEDTFDDFIEEYSGLQVEALGGVLGFTDNQAANVIQNGKIKSIGANKYIVMTDKAQALFKKDGKPLVIEFTAEVQAQQEAAKFIKAKTVESAILKIRGF